MGAWGSREAARTWQGLGQVAGGIDWMEGHRPGEERSLIFGRFWCFRKGFSEEFARPASRAACWLSAPPLLEEQVEESSGFCEARSRQP